MSHDDVILIIGFFYQQTQCHTLAVHRFLFL